MNSTSSHRQPFLSGTSLVGAQGFAIAFAALGMIFRVLTYNITDPNINLALGTVLYAAAGALGAAYLATTMNWRGHTMLFTLAGILGCGGGYLITTFLFTSRLQPDITFRTTLEATYIGQAAVIGALLGLFLGIVIGNPRGVLLLILGGAIGFGIGYLMQTSLNDLLAEPLGDFVGRFTDSDSINLIVASLLWGLGSGLCGLIGEGRARLHPRLELK